MALVVRICTAVVVLATLLQAKVIKDSIRCYIPSLPTPTNRALNQLVTGCQLAMNSGVLQKPGQI
jgi:hypothetical protein